MRTFYATSVRARAFRNYERSRHLFWVNSRIANVIVINAFGSAAFFER